MILQFCVWTEEWVRQEKWGLDSETRDSVSWVTQYSLCYLFSMYCQRNYWTERQRNTGFSSGLLLTSQCSGLPSIQGGVGFQKDVPWLWGPKVLSGPVSRWLAWSHFRTSTSLGLPPPGCHALSEWQLLASLSKHALLSLFPNNLQGQQWSPLF